MNDDEFDDIDPRDDDGPGSFEEFSEYNDQDATDCANGDFNTWEENQIAGEEP